MIRTQVQLADEQADALRMLANRRRVSIASLIREAIDALLEDEGRRDRVERALSAIGSGASGVSDLGEDHDRYLAEP
jgi:Arc/MetJ-type ribon-helix-helix transcriptional regulator